ncbi:MAG: response regulator [Calditrichaceae bacterium]|nr:response regulator [Calditrichaceae bacterium]
MAVDICIIDDNKEFLNVITEYIELNGYSVCSIENPLHAIEKNIEIKPKLIILDVMMPGIDGFTLLKQFKGHPALKDIPVIVISGKMFPPEKKQAMTLGAVAFFSKPAKGQELIEEIKKHI